MGRAQDEEVGFGDPAADMDVAVLLGADGGLPGEGVAAALKQIVVADKDPGLRRQGEDALDRAIQGGGVSAGEVLPGRTGGRRAIKGVA